MPFRAVVVAAAAVGVVMATVVVVAVVVGRRKAKSQRPHQARGERAIDEVDEDEDAARFRAAAAAARKLAVKDTDTQLELYGLFKRATEGAPPPEKPWEPVARAKWNAWDLTMSLTREQGTFAAMQQYIALVARLDATTTTQASTGNSGGPRVSRPVVSDTVGNPAPSTVLNPHFEAVRLNFSKLEEVANASALVTQALDEEGRTLLHWAVDAGDVTAVGLVLRHGGRALVNTKDSDGLTPLGYAASGDMMEIALLLLENAADPNDASLELPASKLTRNAELKVVFIEREQKQG